MIRLLYIDLFCGAGGTTTGVEAARIGGKKCAKVIACVNHDANAIRSHAANHPDALHFTEDIRTLDIAPLSAHLAKCRKLYPGSKVVLWASLECTNFSKAKGGLPRDADSRTLAEHLFRYIEALRLFGCMRLASRIHDLRDRGNNIIVERTTTKSGKRVAQYRLVQ